MKHILTVPRTAITSLLLPYMVHCMLVLLSFVFLIPVAHSTADPGNDFELNRQHIVEEFKAKVLQHMGWKFPPRGYNASKNSLHGKLIREFFRKRFRTGEHQDSFDEVNSLDSHIGDLQTVVFPSTDPHVWVQVQPVITPVGVQAVNTPPSSLTAVEFNTNFQQPEIPYHDLLIKSAILRMCISRQKRKLRGKDKSRVNVDFYLLRNISGDKVTATLLHSRTVNTLRKKNIQFNLKPHLLSHILDSDQTVSIGIKITPISGVNNRIDRLYQLLRNFEDITKQNNVDLLKSQIMISKATLRVTTGKRDLRKSRTKRQDNSDSECWDSLCCRHSIYIDFRDIGWDDWVLEPEGYTAYYCKGGCPNRYLMASSFTGIKNLLHERDPDVVPGPVCAPTGYAPLDLVVYSNEDVTLLRQDNMVVTGCRCH